jgi:hypothetical protein
MGKIKFVASKATQVLGEGKHLVKITHVEDTISKTTGQDQIRMKFEDENGAELDAYFNTVGFLKDKNGAYVLKNGKRVVDAEASAIVQGIIAKLGNNAGIDEGDSFEAEDLLGRTVGIAVEMQEATQGERAGESFPRIKYTWKPVGEALAF